MKPKTNYSTAAGELNTRDRCYTPAYALDPLLPYLRSAKTIWESAVGGFDLVRVFEREGFYVVGGDLQWGIDFFSHTAIPACYDVHVTNPPFSLKYKWLARCYALGQPFALLMPIDTLGAASAQKLFERYGVEVLIMDKRIDFGMPNIGFKGSSSQFSSAWFTWGLHIGSPMTFTHITKGKQQRQKQHQLSLFSE